MNFAWQGNRVDRPAVSCYTSLYDAVVAKMVKKLKALRIGDPLDPDVNTGPMNSKKQYDRVMMLIQEAKDQGAECWSVAVDQLVLNLTEGWCSLRRGC